MASRRVVMLENEALQCADSLPACERWIEANCMIRKRPADGDWLVSLQVTPSTPPMGMGTGHAGKLSDGVTAGTRPEAVLKAAQALRKFLEPWSTDAINAEPPINAAALMNPKHRRQVAVRATLPDSCGGAEWNKRRADWAEEAARAFALATGLKWENVEDRSCAIGDLIGDLLHLARREGMDPHERMNNGLRHFEEEEGEAAEEVNDPAHSGGGAPETIRRGQADAEIGGAA